MTTFDERAAVGEAHEILVADELYQRNWIVTRWGQGILPEITRQAIRDAQCKFAHFPDLIAARDDEVIAIDAKASLHSVKTGRYAVSYDCVTFGVKFYANFEMPLYYVFDNLGVLIPTEIRAYGRRGPSSPRGAYYLVPGELAHRFDDIFGEPGEGGLSAAA